MGRVVAMILAGGRGTRMGILCQERPKPVLPFAGQFRVIDFSLSNCVYSGINQIAVLADHQRSILTKYLRRWSLVNTGSQKMEILEPRAGSYLGTADAVYQNLDYLVAKKAETVLVLAGDHVYQMDYHRMLAFHRRMRADVTVGVVPMPVNQGHRFGIVTAEKNGRIVDFVEKPEMPLSNLASMGIYIFDWKIMSQRLQQDAAEPASWHDFGRSIIPRMVKQDTVFAYQFNDYWQDVGTIEAYFRVHMELTTQSPPLSLNGTRPVLTAQHPIPAARVFPQATVRNSLVSPGCIIKGQVENSILSPGVWIEDEAVVRNSVILANTFVGYHSIVEHSILDEGVSIGKFCYIGVGDTPVPQPEDITVLGQDVTVPPYTAVSRNCKIKPHVKAADFIAKTVPDCYYFAPSYASTGEALSQEGVTANER